MLGVEEKGEVRCKGARRLGRRKVDGMCCEVLTCNSLLTIGRTVVGADIVNRLLMASLSSVSMLWKYLELHPEHLRPAVAL
jgi:hypothetical protein